MRLLILTTERDWSASVRQLAMLGDELATRGHVVVVVCVQGSATERQLQDEFPMLERRMLPVASGIRRTLALRRLVGAHRCEAALVHTEVDALAAANAIGKSGGVVQRIGLGESPRRGWRTRLARLRSGFVVVRDEARDVGGSNPSSAANASASRDGVTTVRSVIAWPSAGEPRLTSRRLTPTMPPPVIAIVAGVSPNTRGQAAHRSAEHIAGAAALRAAAKLVGRHPDLRVQLVGETLALQQLRLHAGSLGLADRLELIAPRRLLSPGTFEIGIVWVAAHGDYGAVAVIAAMTRRIPTLVPRGFDIEPMVAPRITGHIADEADPAGNVSALAQMLSDANAYYAMGSAAAARAERVHSWDVYTTRIADVLTRASQSRTSQGRTSQGGPAQDRA